MSSLILAPPLSGNTIGSTSDNFVIAEWQDPGGPVGEKRLIAPLHLHQSDDEAWYVLEGALRVQVGDTEVEVRAGAAVLVPRLTRIPTGTQGRTNSLPACDDSEHFALDSGNT